MPPRTITVAPIIIPFWDVVKIPLYKIIPITKATYIASPPIIGIGLLCIRLSSLGMSIALTFIAIILTIGVIIIEIKAVTIAKP